MKQPGKFIAAGIGSAILAALASTPTESLAQTTPDEQRSMNALVAEIAQQQAKIVENQKQMDTKIAAIAENLRTARIYVSRGGGKTK